MEELRLAGFRNIQYAEYDADEYYEREEDLIFLLKHTPIIPGLGRRNRIFASCASLSVTIAQIGESGRIPPGL